MTRRRISQAQSTDSIPTINGEPADEEERRGCVRAELAVAFETLSVGDWLLYPLSPPNDLTELDKNHAALLTISRHLALPGIVLPDDIRGILVQAVAGVLQWRLEHMPHEGEAAWRRAVTLDYLWEADSLGLIDLASMTPAVCAWMAAFNDPPEVKYEMLLEASVELRKFFEGLPPLPCPAGESIRARLCRMRDWATDANRAVKALCGLPGSTAVSGERADEQAPAAPNDQSYLGPRELAKMFDVDCDALKKRLERFRKRNHNGWNPVSDPRPREARYLYQVGTVKPIIASMKASCQMSRERPAKKNLPS